MGLLDPAPPPFDPEEWSKRPFNERARLACQDWAMQGYGAPVPVYLAYALKIAGYIGAWVFFCSRSPSLGGLANIEQWWLEPLAFQKAIIWSMLFELLGFGCGSGPLTGRYMPPFGGALYFMRPGTTKLPLFEGAPLIGGPRRTLLDAGVYAVTLVALGWALFSPTVSDTQLYALIVLVPLLGVLDKTLFLVARAEHYWAVLLCFAFAGNWIAGAKAVQLALWFWAGVSKLNRHFPTVVCVMTSNGPFTRFPWLRRRMYRSYPDDLRPSRLATAMAHVGTVLEFAVPSVLIWAGEGTPLLVGMVLMLMLHGYITSNVPMAVPLEWNVMMVYGGFALFWAHPEVTILDIGSLPMAAALAVMLIALPLIGNFFPRLVSFLLAMRYYAGNWPISVWLFRGDSRKKLDKLVTPSRWIDDQLGFFYERPTVLTMQARVMAFRLMHFHGRFLPGLLHRAAPDLDERVYAEGEVISGMILGWNFGDGHLHGEQLLRGVQAQCGFEPGELRCVVLESQPLFGRTQRWSIVDAASGVIEEGEVVVADILERQPWELPPGFEAQFEGQEGAPAPEAAGI
ncbi:DUF3556 domain-containing protein [Pseudenhygromyxa sp. WMMC2535]|uniref:DUF3556 domain-containing protein n=1 Tax=Pseudenhygromyxa sp. WMMC2535 TaxID=2712867 RepID=UPI001551FE17|nr:DUF3556 domain-containing protein [Pseudenhygromyxa sp. WMMC2535]NVB40683.1 DUF3556 domain-containing protein [Pseudenhygromyxa sp. WMMC2535]